MRARDRRARARRRTSLIHPADHELARWYAACDVLLMTSVFEGVPYVVFEAMAMGLPVVAPALPGNVELLGDWPAALVEPRDDVGRLRGRARRADRATPSGARDAGPPRCASASAERFSLAAHGAGARARSTTRLLAPRRRRGPTAAAEPRRRPPPLRFATAPLHDTPLVSVIVPCFNHGRFLRECLDAIRAQTPPGGRDDRRRRRLDRRARRSRCSTSSSAATT